MNVDKIPNPQGREQVLQNYLAVGWKLFPLAGETKIPRKGSEWRDKPAGTPEEIAEFRDGDNVAVHVGASGLFVVDLDDRDALNTFHGVCDFNDFEPVTPMAGTPSGGAHIFFRAPEGLELSPSADVQRKVDVRAGYSYIVLAPSRFNGKAYEWRAGYEPWTVETLDAPEWLIRWAYGVPDGNTTPERSKTLPDPGEALPDQIPQGGRHAYFTALAGRLWKSGVDRDTVWRVMREEYEEKAEHSDDFPNELRRIWQDITAKPRDGYVEPGVWDEILRTQERARDEDTPDPDTDPLAYFPTSTALAEDPALLEEPPAVIHGIAYQGRITVLAGLDKSGKSTLTAHAVGAVTRGDEFLGVEAGAQGRVLWIGPDESVGDTVRKLEGEASAAPNMVHVLRHDQIHDSAIPKVVKAGLDELDPVLVVIDSLTEWARRVHESGVPGDGDNSEWAKVVRPLADLSRRYDVAILLLHHARRSDGRARGGSEIFAAVDATMELKIVEEGGPDRILSGRGRFTVPTIHFRYNLRESRFETNDGRGYMAPELRLEDRILIALRDANGPMSKNELERTTRGRAARVREAVERLVGERRVLEVRGYNGHPAYRLPTVNEGLGLDDEQREHQRPDDH